MGYFPIAVSFCGNFALLACRWLTRLVVRRLKQAVARLFQAYEDGDNVVLDTFGPEIVAGLLKKWLFNLRAPMVPHRVRSERCGFGCTCLTICFVAIGTVFVD